MMTTPFLVHSIRNPQDDTLTHNLQSTNRGRLQQATRRLMAEGYEIVLDPWSQDGWHAVTFWSLRNKLYHRASKSAHREVLDFLGISDGIDVRTNDLITTEAMVATSSRTLERGARSMSPRRLTTRGGRKKK